jgi:hypothetical protein
MFGFGRLASYDYFEHLERALSDALRKRGDETATWVLDVPPTASVRRRAGKMAELVARTSDDDGEPVHIVGHSTGGVDARLVASPGARLPCDPSALEWLPRLASVTTLSTPHHGTPLASFFATVSGQRMLYALSALTFIALTLGSPPLAAASALVVAIGRIDRALGLDIRVLDKTTEALLRVLDEARSREVRAYLDAINQDDERYPCAERSAGDETEAMLKRVFGRTPGARANDGVVPIRSQLWGKLVWAGYADHLDVLGHFDGSGRGRGGDPRHVDWLRSGADFDRPRFEAMAEAIAEGMIEAGRRMQSAERSRRSGGGEGALANKLRREA